MGYQWISSLLGNELIDTHLDDAVRQQLDNASRTTAVEAPVVDTLGQPAILSIGEGATARTS